MRFPDLRTLGQLGRQLRRVKDFSAEQANHIVLAELGVNGTLEHYLTEHAN